eukprot:TRINITY_DN7793_c1_g1_i1.p2 TRINITY_DN7793_c1_g1~~TRINITY_DN7793_c1_g1_i1.p2  ORF type:complete len:153 (+),score=82.10 TRINITY_DN7793_c1_g1_i1:116-574(+)
MGRVRTKTVKKASRQIIEKHYPRLTHDFQTNKKMVSEVALIQTKRLRNKIAGFVTHLMKRIARGPVPGISFKLQEEEREKRDSYVPPESAIKTDSIRIDSDTKELLNAMNLGNLTGFEIRAPRIRTRKSKGGAQPERPKRALRQAARPAKTN